MSNASSFHPSPQVLEILRYWPDLEASVGKDIGRYLEFLLTENQKFNLTGDKDPERQWKAHVEDVLLAAREIAEFLKPRGASPAAARIADIGSGAGIPGLVWAKIWPGSEVRLVEATEKKCRFLEQAAEIIGANNVRVLKGRAEDLAREDDHREMFDIVVARGLAQMRVLAEWTLPFVKPGGHLIAIKGAEIDGEIDDSAGALEVLGGEHLPQCLPYTRSDGKACQVVACEKTRPTPPNYPRRPGVARKRPL